MDTALTFDLAPDEREIFLADVDQHLRAMETGLLGLERGADPILIATIFRAAHTLKALAGMVGHRRMADLTHALETLFEALRDGQVSLTAGATDDLLAALDTLNVLRDEVVTGRRSAANVAIVRSRIMALLMSLDSMADAAQGSSLLTEEQLERERPPSALDQQLNALQHQPILSHERDKMVRISVERLDTLMDLVGELVTDRTRLAQLAASLREHVDTTERLSALSEVTAHLGRVVGQLQAEVFHARMLPIARLFDTFPRLVRDSARAAGKQVEVQIIGASTELDRSMIEGLHDALIHLVRNAIDHGIERAEERAAAGKPGYGKLQLAAAHEQGQMLITVSDDGRGIDPRRIARAAIARDMLTEGEADLLDDAALIDMIFLPRLSTAIHVTELSGRGIGMDVVRSRVERLTGTIAVTSQIGQGTTFRITLPLTLTIVPTMLVALGASIFALPLTSIIDLWAFRDQRIDTIKGNPTIQCQNTNVPLLDMRQLFAHPQIIAAPRSPNPAIVTIGWGKLRAGLVVDQIIGQQEVVVKLLSPLVGSVPGISGSATLGDGRIALIVDIPALLKRALQDYL